MGVGEASVPRSFVAPPERARVRQNEVRHSAVKPPRRRVRVPPPRAPREFSDATMYCMQSRLREGARRDRLGIELSPCHSRASEPAQRVLDPKGNNVLADLASV